MMSPNIVLLNVLIILLMDPIPLTNVWMFALLANMLRIRLECVCLIALLDLSPITM